jgi:hypothetical protein
MFCTIPKMRQSSRKNLAVNRVSLSLMRRDGSPYRKNTCFMYKAAVSSTDMASLQGMKIAALVQS